MIKCTWQTTSPRNQLLGHLHPSHCMAGYPLLFHPLHHTQLENMTIGFHHGLSTGTHPNPTVHEHSKGI